MVALAFLAVLTVIIWKTVRWSSGADTYAITLGLGWLILPFLPAANLFFYVGTYVVEWRVGPCVNSGHPEAAARSVSWSPRWSLYHGRWASDRCSPTCSMDSCRMVVPKRRSPDPFSPPAGFTVAERVTYATSVGFCLLAGYVLSKVYARRRWAQTVGCLPRDAACWLPGDLRGGDASGDRRHGFVVLLPGSLARREGGYFKPGRVYMALI